MLMMPADSSMHSRLFQILGSALTAFLTIFSVSSDQHSRVLLNASFRMHDAEMLAPIRTVLTASNYL